MKNKEITIRYVQKGEAKAITNLKMRSKASNGYSPEFMDACRDELSVSEGDFETLEIWVAERDHAIVGMLDIRFEDARCILEALFIDPEIKSAGIGRLMFEKCEQRCREAGASLIEVDSDPEAQAFYEKMGMIKTGEIPSGSIAGRFLPRLEKHLR
ncbi:MAG: GNAT family N-acetyltransferase [Acidimicrobiales bacterium]|nr:GNAT family N-acetyltransferase [Hyphomonadaceae bacterium]RZV35070.1 MAG: GNAT family N-acetyltransferase [Acidimicrobiales bacterium]